MTFELDAADPKLVNNVIVTVFDTIPPANSICITRTGIALTPVHTYTLYLHTTPFIYTGLLYAASEFGNHSLFQFQGIDDPNAIKSERIMDDALNEELGDDSFSAARVAPLFKVQGVPYIHDIHP